MIIAVHDLTKHYHPGNTVVKALNRVSFSIQPGEFVAVQGASGCGKSTLLHLLGLLSAPTSGRHVFCGEDVQSYTEEERARIRNQMIGFVFQQFHLLPRLSILENVALPAVYHQGRPDLAHAADCLDRLGIVDLAGRRPNELSGGQQQRVAIARALIHRPQLLLADEPTGNLDSYSSDAVLEALETLHRDGATLLVVTHNPDVAKRSQRQIHLQDGLIVKDTASTAAPCMDSNRRPITLAKAARPPLLRLYGVYFGQAFRALKAQAGRAALSALGILIGTFSVMMTVLLIAGARETIGLQLEALGTNLMIISPRADRVYEMRAQLSVEDARAVAALPDVTAVAGIILGQAALSSAGGSPRPTLLAGGEPSLVDLSGNRVSTGRFFSDEETRRHARVAILGVTPAQTLFGHTHPIGQTVFINGLPFRVIGLTPERGLNPWHDMDDIVVIPITTAMRSVLGRTGLDQMHLEVRQPHRMEAAEQAIRAMLTRRHPTLNIDDVFRFRNMARLRRIFEDVTAVLSSLLYAMSLLSLLVGGIGIMNIMLVAVTERTREVGLRKALGARVEDILAQFLTEAALLSMLGGAAGVGLGFILHRLTGGFGVPLAWAWAAAGVSFIAAGTTGVVFGMWPAWRAARYEPVDALRHE